MKIPIINQKGGVAKSTTAINLGAGLALAGDLGLARRDFRTLVIDLDPQASTSYALTGGREDAGPHLGDVLLAGVHIEDAIRHTSTPNLTLITAAEALGSDEELLKIAFSGGATDPQRLAFMRRFRRRLLDALAMIQTPTDIVLFDCPAGVGLPLTLAMTAGDRFLIPSKVDRLGRVYRFLDHLIALRAGSPYRMASIMGILLTDVNYQVGDTQEREVEIRAAYEEYVLDTVIRRNVTIERAQKGFRTVFEEDPQLHSSGAQCYRDVVAEVLLRGIGCGIDPDELTPEVKMRGARLALPRGRNPNTKPG